MSETIVEAPQEVNETGPFTDGEPAVSKTNKPEDTFVEPVIDRTPSNEGPAKGDPDTDQDTDPDTDTDTDTDTSPVPKINPEAKQPDWK